ncbi:MAG: SMI1/KNR4 family protein [Candidatus Zixiibacteriota bacterium]|jgi:hypothetical protein
MSTDIVELVRTRASNPETIHDMAMGLSPAPKIYPAVTADVIAAAEKELGFALPPLLKRVYTEIGNGGFGPGYGLNGLSAGLDEEGYPASLEALYAALREEPPQGFSSWPEGFIPLCTWGCAIDSYVDCTDAKYAVSVFNPESHCLDSGNVTATLTTADGEVIELDSLEELGLTSPGASSEKPASGLVRHKETLEEWLAAWARGVDLWTEMEALWSGGDQSAWQSGGHVN